MQYVHKITQELRIYTYPCTHVTLVAISNGYRQLPDIIPGIQDTETDTVSIHCVCFILLCHHMASAVSCFVM